MFGNFTPYGSARPIAMIGRVPVTLTLVFTAAQCLSLIAGVFFLKAGWMNALVFDTAQVWRGEAWRILAYGLANDVRNVSPLWFLLGLVFFYIFGGMVEARLGAARFGFLYSVIWLAPPLLMLAGSPLFGRGLLAGSSMIHLGCFIAFAALFPNLAVLFSLTAKWVAAGFAGIAALQMTANSDWNDLWALFGLSVFAIWLARRLEESEPFQTPLSDVLEPVRKLASGAGRPRLRAMPPPDDPERVVDQLLDKISKRGISSLTAAERRRLEEARIALIRRDEKK